MFAPFYHITARYTRTVPADFLPGPELFAGLLLRLKDTVEKSGSIIIASDCFGIRDGHMEHMADRLVFFAAVAVQLAGDAFF